MIDFKVNNIESVKLTEIGACDSIIPCPEYFKITVKIDSFLRDKVVEGFKLSDGKGNIFELNEIICSCEDGSLEAEFISLGNIDVSLGEIILFPIFVGAIKYFPYYIVLEDMVFPRYNSVKKGNYVCFLDGFLVRDLEVGGVIKKVGEISDSYLGKEIIDNLSGGIISDLVKDQINNILCLYEGYIKIEERSLDF